MYTDQRGLLHVSQVSTDQRGRLMMTTERLNQSTDRIKESRRTMLETEELGVSILQDLHQQRQSLLHAHTTVCVLSQQFYQFWLLFSDFTDWTDAVIVTNKTCITATTSLVHWTDLLYLGFSDLCCCCWECVRACARARAKIYVLLWTLFLPIM